MKDLMNLPVARLEVNSRVHYDAKGAYQYFTKPHPKLKVFKHKAWGAALIDLQAFTSPTHYLESIKGHNNGAYFAKKARTRGYVVREINRNEHIDEIHDINTSQDVRQGRPMDQAYFTKRTAYTDEKNYKYFGCFSKEGKLMAYCDIGFYGNFAVANRILGYRNNDGITHFLLIEIISRFIEERSLDYVMYDTFFGAQPGLKTFKTILGFKPYRAKYVLIQDDPHSRQPVEAPLGFYARAF